MNVVASEAGPAPPAGEGAPLYAGHVKVYPQRVGGRFRRIKWAVLIALLAIYYVAPWLRWDRGPGAPDQALLIDIPGRRAYFFFIEIWPQEVYFLAGLLIVAALALFLVTALIGRVWCGFTCPQTVWTDLFMLVERWIEGDRNKRMKLDQAPLTWAKALRKTAKHAVWLVIALATGGAWIAYFNDAPTAVRQLATGEAGPLVYAFVGLFTGTTYLLAGWAREQVCIYMCPWPRFQSAMFDEHSFLVTYETWRGEPRGHAKAGQSFEGRGHCIDCGLCVNVCPTGIDIRDGQQLACIGCGLCIDACNSVMPKVGLPGELITYDSLASQEARGRGAAFRRRVVRPRTLVYAGVLAVAVVVMAGALAQRSSFDMSLLPDRAPLFVALKDGRIQNAYTLKILNKERRTRGFAVSVEGLAGAQLEVLGREGEAEPDLAVAADSVGTFRMFVRVPRESLEEESAPLAIVAVDLDTGASVRHETIFSGPRR
jgi:cytochrome c oxidase accessory protein FixG